MQPHPDRTDEFRLTTGGVIRRLHDQFGILRTPDTIRWWGRMGRLPVRLLDNGQYTFRARDVDELGARLAAEHAPHVA